jgi:3-oxoacyl-[acyl-carrier protein] reductase
VSAESGGIVDRTVEHFGRIDLLVNNAGITADNLLAAMPDDDIERVLQTNLAGAIFCTRAAVRYLVAQRGGAIINLSSVAAARPGRGQSVYAAAKGGIEAFTRAMAVELAPRQIRVNAVAPGVIETDMSRAVATAGHGQIMDRLLVKRLGTVDDVARVVRFLADPANSYITGEVINVTGGMKMP